MTVRFLAKASRGITPDGVAKAVDEMRTAGVVIGTQSDPRRLNVEPLVGDQRQRGEHGLGGGAEQQIARCDRPRLVSSHTQNGRLRKDLGGD